MPPRRGGTAAARWHSREYWHRAGIGIAADRSCSSWDGIADVSPVPNSNAMLDRIAGNGVHTIIVESPDRFARDLAILSRHIEFPLTSTGITRPGGPTGRDSKGNNSVNNRSKCFATAVSAEEGARQPRDTLSLASPRRRRGAGPRNIAALPATGGRHSSAALEAQGGRRGPAASWRAARPPAPDRRLGFAIPRCAHGPLSGQRSLWAEFERVQGGG
jgi:hypothetical protein